MGTGKTTFDCNYFGITIDELSSQADELSSAGVSISSNPDDQNYCWYESGGEFINPAGIEAPFFKLNGLFYPDSLFVYFNKEAPDEISLPPQFSDYLRTDPKIEIAEFFVAGERPSYSLGIDDDVTSAEETILRHIKTAWPDSVIIDSDIKITSQTNGHQNYTVYIAGYNLPSGVTKDERAKRPSFDTTHCPEWVTHEEVKSGDIKLDGWEFTLRASPPQADESRSIFATAIPRNELKETALYAEHLRSRLGFSEYLKSDNPIRLIREITFTGDNGVQGLYCPVFEIEILEIEKSEQNCLEWVERKEKKDIQAERVGKNGYLVPLGNGGYKYISATKTRGVEDAKSLIYNRAPDRGGFDKVVSSRRILDDPVCSADEIKVGYSKLPTPVTPPDHGKDDARRLEQLFLRDPAKLRKIRGLEQLGPIKWARPAEDGPARAENLINVIKAELHEDDPVERMEVCLVVDQSGSMADDSQYVSDRFDELEAELAASANDVGLCLIRFVDDEEEVIVRLAQDRELHDYASDMREGLSAIAENPHGSLEYIYEVAGLALDQFEYDGVVGSKRKIILLTDEKGDLKDGGRTLEGINRRAEGLGVDFRTVFIASAGSEHGQLKDYLEYLNTNGIDPQKMNEGEKIGLWEKMLKDKGLSLEGKIEVIKRLSEVSRQNRDRAVRVVIGILGRTEDRYSMRDLAAAYEALGRLGGGEAEEALYSTEKEIKRLSSLASGMREAFEYNEFSGLKPTIKIVDALVNIGTASALAKAKELAMEDLRGWWLSWDKTILKLAKAFDEGEIEVLGKKLREFDREYPTYLQIIKVLGENGSKKAQDILIAFLGSSWDKRDRQEYGKGETALAILKNRYHPQAMSVLISNFRILTLPLDYGESQKIAKIFMRYEKRLSNAELEKVMQEYPSINPPINNDGPGYLAALMLAKRGDKNAIAHIGFVVHGDEHRITEKWRLADSAGLYKDRSAIPWLEILLLDNDKHVWYRTLAALRNIDDDRARELTSFATMGDSVTIESASAIAKTDPRKAIDQLIALCHDLDSSVRISAARELAEVGDESAIPVLSELLGGPDALVIEAAGRAIEEINKRIELERVLQQSAP